MYTLSERQAPKRRHVKVLPLLATLVCGSALAQDFERIAPKPVQPPRQIQEGSILELRDRTVRVKALTGIVFLSDPQAVRREGMAGISGVDVSRVPELQTDAFKTRMAKYLGNPVSLASIDDLVRDVVAYFNENDRPFVVASSPEQEITGGVLQILVIEGKVGEVKIIGAKIFDEKIYRNAIGLKPGDPIMKRKLDANIEWLNRNPFRDATLQLEPGKSFGTTDVTVRARERPPVRLYAGFDDTGTKVTGNNRVLAGVNWGNVFGLDHQLNYQFTANPNFDHYRAHSATYIAPLPWRHLLTVFGAYADIKGDVPAPFSLQGRSAQIGLRYEVPLEKIGAYNHGIIAGLDYKRTNNNLEFGLTNVSASNADVVQGVLSYNANMPDTSGTTSFTASVYYSPGGATGDNSDRNFQTLRALAQSRYAYANLKLQRITRLPRDFAWHFSAVAQFADGNLLGSEQLGAGGYATVRGYNEREANGDEGFLVRNELRTPSWNMGAPFQGKQAQLQLLSFLDYGFVRNKHLLPGEPRHVELSSTGLGLRIAVDQNVSFRFDQGWQLHDTGVAGGRKNSRQHFALQVNF